MSIQAQDPTFIERFKAKANEFLNTFERLKAMATDVSRFPSLQSEYSQLVERGRKIQNAIQGATGAVDTVWDWFQHSFGLEGVDYARQNYGQQLGAIPVVIGAVSIASLVWFINSVYQFERKLNELKRLEGEGKIDADRQVSTLYGDESGLWANARKAIVPIGIAALGVWLISQNRGQ